MTKLRQDHGGGSPPCDGSPGGDLRFAFGRRLRRGRTWSSAAGAVAALLLLIVMRPTLLNVMAVIPASGSAGAAAAGTPYVYVLSGGSVNSVTEFAKGTNGDQAPVATITGPRTGLTTPKGLTVDAMGNVFVSNGNNTVIQYAKGASGDQAPNTTLQGSNTGLNGPSGLAVDSGQNLYVTNTTGCSVTAYVGAGTTNAAGNVTPKTTLQGSNTRLLGPTGVALSGGTMTVANSSGFPCGVVPSGPGQGLSVVGAGVTEYASGANGNQTPIATISSPNPGTTGPLGVAVDSAGNLFVSDESNNSVTEYTKGANGNRAPIAVITGPSTGLNGPSAVAVDAQEHVFVSNKVSNTVTEYGPGANGNQLPIATIRGQSTGLKSPVGLAVPPIPLGTPPVTTPGAPTIGSASEGNRSSSITFSPPASNGGLPIVSYTAKAEDLFNGATKTVTGPGAPITVPDLSNGDKYVFSVAANNILGAGAYSNRSNQVTPVVPPGARGDGSNDKPYLAECDNPKPVDCDVFFPVKDVGGNKRASVPAYKCPASHPYLLNHDYKPFLVGLPMGVEIVQPQSPWPIGISITGTSTVKVTIKGMDRNVTTGTTTGGDNSSLTNWTGDQRPFKVILHCTSDVTHAYVLGGRFL